MSIQAMLDSVLPLRSNLTETSNSTNDGNIRNQVFESIIPGYGPIHKFILYTFGIDITILVTLFAAIWAISKLAHYVYMTIYTLIAENYMSSIHISSYDDIYSHLMKWLADQPRIKGSRSLMAETQHKSAWEVDEEEVEEKSEDGVELDYLNFSNQEAKAPPRFIPAFGAHRFWHNRTYFLLHRVQKTYMESSSSATFVEKEDLTLSCFGRSPQPIKDLLQDAKDFYLRDHSAKTVIRRPAPKDMRRWGGRNVWTQIAHRPCRPMETVVLDAERKADVLRDINEYLHPATPRWYANRGIPYRRGYLFHGPPGTGKTVSPSHEFCLFKNNHTNGLAVTLFCLSWSFWT
jgi:chaperone BCS1